MDDSRELEFLRNYKPSIDDLKNCKPSINNLTMDRTCELCGHRNEENCNSCPDMEKPKVTQIRGTAYPMNEFFWKLKYPQHWKALQKIKELVVTMTQGEVTVHFRYPEAKKPKIINKENEKDKTQGQNTQST